MFKGKMGSISSLLFLGASVTTAWFFFFNGRKLELLMFGWRKTMLSSQCQNPRQGQGLSPDKMKGETFCEFRTSSWGPVSPDKRSRRVKQQHKAYSHKGSQNLQPWLEERLMHLWATSCQQSSTSKPCCLLNTYFTVGTDARRAFPGGACGSFNQSQQVPRILRGLMPI